MNPKVTIIIRTHNEEDWIRHCLQSVFEQNYNNFEVIIVDNQSDDNTIKIAKNFPIKSVELIDKYIPGKALNTGIRAANGSLLAFLSAHCIPKHKNWLSILVSNFNSNKVAGVYGRQIPTSFSKPNDFRDLFITFGLDKRVQKKDYFFHNANSMIRKDLWKNFPFDEKLTNIEDRAWAKQIIQEKYHLVYEPNAEVFHFHGIHQNQKLKRSNSTIKVLKDIEKFIEAEYLPISMTPSKINISAIIPINESLAHFKNQLTNSIKEVFSNNRFVLDINIISNSSSWINKLNFANVNWLKRPKHLSVNKAPLSSLLIWALEEINKHNKYPDYIFYINPDYIYRPKNILKNLIHEACFNGFDSVAYGYKENSNIFVYDEEINDFKSYGDSLDKKDKPPIFKTLYGLGCLTKPKVIKKGKLMAKSNIGIIPITDFRYNIRLGKEQAKKLIEMISFND